jgi:RIO kinase 1
MNEADKLGALLLDGTIDEILGPLQSGKEASLFVVRRGDEVMAAKVYKDRDHRSFKNNALYVEGRKHRNSRDERALARGSRHGKATQESLWRTAESEAMGALHEAGVNVPRPFVIRDGVILMELVTGSGGEPAPRLVDTRPTRDEARKIHAILLAEIEKMLVAGWIHGDLSAYNILVSARGPVIIDFPQAVSVSHNNQARRLVERDIANVTDFLAGFDPALAGSRSSGSALWERYQRGDLGSGPGGLEIPGDPEDALARQIAHAIALPQSHGPARRRGRAGRKPPVSPKPEKPDARKAPERVERRLRKPAECRSAKQEKRPSPERREPRAPKRTDLWGSIANRYGLGGNPQATKSRPSIS